MKTFSASMKMMLATALCVFMASCTKTEIKGTAIEQEPDVYQISLGWTGEIEIDEEPLVRSGNNTDLYGIQAYYAPYNGEETEQKSTTWTRYAFGLFSGDEDIKISLLKGYKYKFEATMVVDGKNKIAKYTNPERYRYPFYASGTESGPSQLLGTFTYQSATYMSDLTSGYTSLASGGYYYRPSGIDRYYGELVDYVPGLNNNKAKIHMKRASFGAKFKAQGKLAKEGTLEIQMTDSPKINIDLSSGTKEHTDIYCFNNVKAAYTYDKGNYTETVNVSMNWHQPDGKVVPFGTHKITYKRNATTVVTVKIESTNADEGIGLEYDEVGEMPEDGENDAVIEDGSRVDTEIETNK